MGIEKVIEIFNDLLSGKRPDIKFSKGYKEFEQVYEAMSEYFIRTDVKTGGYITSIITRRI